MLTFKNANDVPDPMSLLTTDEILVVSLRDHAFHLHGSIGDKLVPNPEGIYVRGKLFPVISPKDQLFILETGKPVKYENLATINESVCNNQGKVLITKDVMCRKQTMLSYSGFYPISALQLLKANVDLNIRRYSRFAAPFTNETVAINYLKPEHRHLFSSDFFDDYTSDALEQAFEFISKDNWRIYFTKVMADSLYIERSIDYRIFDWTRTQYEKLHPDNDE